MKKVEIFTDDNTEMIKIIVDGNGVFEGNEWDIRNDTWISILKSVGTEVEEKPYTYAD